MEKFIEYQDFIDDLLKNITFKGCLSGDLRELGQIKTVLKGTDCLQDKVYSLNKGEVADFFYYKGEKLVYAHGGICSFSEGSVLKGVKAYVGEEFNSVKKVESEIKQALSAYEQIVALQGTSLVSMDEINFIHEVERMARWVYGGFEKLVKLSVGHTIGVGKFEPVPFREYCNAEVYKDNHDDWSYETFLKFFNPKTVLDELFNACDAVQIERAYHEANARKIALGFKDCDKLKSGVRFSERWRSAYWGNGRETFGSVSSHCASLDFFKSLESFFWSLDDRRFFKAIRAFKHECLGVGDGSSHDGIKIRLYKEHYKLTLSNELIKKVLLYVNKYAGDYFSQCVVENEKLSA